MGNMINLDSTVFIQLINFLVTVVVLQFLLIKPILNQVATRKALTSDHAASIEKFTSEASEKLADFEASLAKARAEATVIRDNIKHDGQEREQALIKAAHDDAQSFLATSREKTAKEAKNAMDTLLSQVNGYATAAVSKILG